MKSAVNAFLVCIVLSATAFGVEVKPANISIPSSPGGTFSFDFIVTNPPSQAAYTAQLTINRAWSNPPDLTFNTSASQSVLSNTSYWVWNNSQGTPAVDNGDGTYTFGDGPENAIAESINNGDILARFAFTWNGTTGNYEFILDKDTTNSFVRLADFSKAGFTLPTGQWFTSPIVGATDSSFTIHIPEPVTVLLFGIGGLFVLRKHKK
jgi:hypothetical protein